MGEATLAAGFKTEPVGIVKATIGTVKAIDPSGAERELQAGDKVYAGEAIVTADAALVMIEFASGTHMDLPPASKLVLDDEILAANAAPPESLTVEQIQEMIARGEDPTAVTEASAAGAAGGDEGGSSFVVVDFSNGQGAVTSGFNTVGIPTPVFPALQQELLPVDDTGAVPPADDGATLRLPGAMAVDEANLPGGSNPDPAALTQTGQFTAGAAGGVLSLEIDGQTIIADGVFTPVALTSGLGNTLAITGYDPTTGEVSYSYTLLDHETHAAVAGRNELSESFSVTLTGTGGGTASGNLEVTIRDDIPTANDDVAELSEARGQDMNFAFVLDFSSSIDNAELNQMMDAIKAAALEIFNKAPGEVSLSVVAFSATSLTYGPFDSYDAFIAQMNALNPIDGGTRPLGPGTDFTDAIQTTMDFYQPLAGASNQVFFISDGSPNQQLGSGGHALNDATAAAWQDFLANNGVQVTSIGIGNNLQQAGLQDVDVDGGKPILVTEFNGLVDTLIPLVQPATTFGNVFDNDSPGADGARPLSIELLTPAGLVTYTWDGNNTITVSGAETGTLSGQSVSVNTALGGMFTFYFAAVDSNPPGQWLYTAPYDVAGSADEIFSYRVIDGDGDTADGQLTITVTDRNAVLSGDSAALRDSAALSVAALPPLPTQTVQGNLLSEIQAAPGASVLFANAMALTVAGVDIAGAYGVLHLAADGDYVYAPYAGTLPQDATEQFSYILHNEDDSTALATVSFKQADQGISAHFETYSSYPVTTESILGTQSDQTIFNSDTQEHLAMAETNDFPLPSLSGGNGNDTVIGGGNSEILKGSDGNDILIAGGGNDILVGGEGDDSLTGGAGRDTFVWNSGDHGHDTVTDFTPGFGGDVLNLSDLLEGEHQDAASLGSYLSFSFDGNNTNIVIDADGAGPAAATQTIVLQNVDLTANNTLPNTAIIGNLLTDGNLKTDP